MHTQTREPELSPGQIKDRIRWRASRVGYRMQKSRARRRPIKGGYRLIDNIGMIVLGGYAYGATLDDVKRFLETA